MWMCVYLCILVVLENSFDVCACWYPVICIVGIAQNAIFQSVGHAMFSIIGIVFIILKPSKLYIIPMILVHFDEKFQCKIIYVLEFWLTTIYNLYFKMEIILLSLVCRWRLISLAYNFACSHIRRHCVRMNKPFRVIIHMHSDGMNFLQLLKTIDIVINE